MNRTKVAFLSCLIKNAGIQVTEKSLIDESEKYLNFPDLHSIPAVRALEIGIAIHHGKLPNPFLRELEMLLSKGIIKVTAASPTLSQGLNINAAVLLVPYLVRAGQTIKGVEFANVAGRAGRAFVDVEGLVLHVMSDKIVSRTRAWKTLVDSSRERILTSGLFYVLNEIYQKLSSRGILNRSDAYEYLAGNRESWTPGSGIEDDEDDPEKLIDKLDNIVLGLVKALDADAGELPKMLEEALQGSLWLRQVERASFNLKEIHEKILNARASLIWTLSSPSARKGYYAMGIGLDSGLAIDAIADELEIVLEKADLFAINGDEDNLADHLILLAEHLFTISPFSPSDNELPDNWRDVLQNWVKGTSIDDIGAEYMPMIESVFCYRLVWAFEAVRVRRISYGWKPEYTTGGASAAIENGVPQLMMSMLIRAGLPSRKAAIIAIRESMASFNDIVEMQEWLKSDRVAELTQRTDWPTVETAEIWRGFRINALSRSHPMWRISYFQKRGFDENSGTVPPPGKYRVEINPTGEAWLCTPDFKRIIKFKRKASQTHFGLLHATIIKDEKFPIVKRYGAGKLNWI